MRYLYTDPFGVSPLLANQKARATVTAPVNAPRSDAHNSLDKSGISTDHTILTMIAHNVPTKAMVIIGLVSFRIISTII